MENKRLFLLDAYALIFRAYYALIKAPRFTRDGFNTSAVFGFVNTLEELLRKEHPSHLAVCFDPAGPTFRSEAFTEYKGTRQATPEDIKLSIPIIKEILKAYNIPVVEKEGFEADDVIGTLAKRAETEGFTTYMMTPDKDFGQLVTPSILQFKPPYRGKDFELRGVEEVIQKYGIESPLQVIDLLALWGDASDNIPGCPGVGEKTAVKLIREFGSVENLLAHTDMLKGAMRTKVEENAEQIKFSKFLATIRTDVPLEVQFDSLKVTPPDTEKLFAIFDSLEFRTLTDRVRRRLAESVAKASRPTRTAQPSLFDFGDEEVVEASASQVESSSLASIPHTFISVDTQADIDDMNARLMQAQHCGLAMLTEGENDMALTWKATALAIDSDTVWYIPTSNKAAVAALLDIMARPDIEKVTANAKTDMVCAWRFRKEILGDDDKTAAWESPLNNYFDISLAHYLLYPDGRHGLDTIAPQLLNYTMLPAPPQQKRSAPESPESAMNRLCEAAMISLRLRQLLEEEVRKIDEWNLLTEIEFPLASVLAKMEITGVRIDVPALNEAAAEMEGKIADLEQEIYSLAGVEFNVGSPAKVGEILFDRLGLDPKAKKTKTGQYSTSEDILEKVAHKNPIVGKILEYRRLRKLLNTYLTALPEAINPATGRVHTNYNQTVTATGRISSSNPNLQNIPVREELGREIRRAFIPSEGNLFLSADYSQIELRLVADFANDETMLTAFRNGDDIHAITAAKIYHKDLEEVSADERRHAKTANFGILYGISAFGLASRLGIPRAEAKALIDNYFRTFPTISRYMAESVERARESGYAVTPAGRRRPLPDILSRNAVVRGYAERNAINAPIQGAAADIIKRAMIDIDAEMSRLDMKSKMIMQVHDELNFDVVPEELPELQNLVAQRMEQAYQGRVTLSASSGVASNWLDAH